MPHRMVIGFLVLILPGVSLAWAESGIRILRFSDTPALLGTSGQPTALLTLPSTTGPAAPEVSARDWLARNQWKRVWPLLSFGKAHVPTFAGPSNRRYLHVRADNTFYIWARRLDIDPHQYPWLTMTWGVDRFPPGAALDRPERNDRAIAVTISFGPAVSSSGLLPNVPRGLAFFWGETETVGMSYTCIPPRQGPANIRMQCTYPHIKFIALRRGSAGSVQTDHVNLLRYFQRYFPDYWQRHRHVPPIVGVGFEAHSTDTDSVTSARLYTIAFTREVSQDGHASTAEPEGS